jgi:hypothetical protein
MVRAWEIVKKEAAEEAAAGEKRRGQLIDEDDADATEEQKKSLHYIPLPKDGEDEDAYWMEYLRVQVSHIQKHQMMLDGGSPVKMAVLRFFTEAMLVVKAAKVREKATVAA